MFGVRKFAGWPIAVSMAVVLLAAVAAFWRLCDRSPQIEFLSERGPAHWIVYPKPPDDKSRRSAEISAVFRRVLVLERAPDHATTLVRALKRSTVSVNGVLLEATATPANWKQPTMFELSRALRPGTNEIEVTVINTNGPPALWLALDAGAGGVVSDGTWEVSLMEASWQKAKLAAAAPQLANGNELAGAERPGPSLWRHLPRLLVFGLLAAGILIFGRRRLESYVAKGESSGSVHSEKFARIALAIPAVLWLALFINNLSLIAPPMGYDGGPHLDYVTYIRDHWQIPLADQGWQMYQPPLYYLICAVVVSLFDPGNFQMDAVGTIRLLGLVIGIAHFALVFFGLRLLFPKRLSAQLFGLALVAFLPETIYLAHYPTNESLAAAFTTGALYFCLRICLAERATTATFAGLGLCLGAALLTKITAVLVVPFVGVVLVGGLFPGRGGAWRAELGKAGLAVFAALAVCGWHYARVWHHFGTPLVGNWDAASGYHWWMETGYRTAGYFFRFGRCLSYPWFAGFNGFADGLYSTLWGDGMWGGAADINDRPPWNYELMAAGFLLALLPTALIVIGFLAAIRRFIARPDAAWFLLLGVTASTLAALVFMSIKLPGVGEVKAFYGLIALLPLCAFGTLGWELVSRRGKIIPFALATLMGAWVINSYASFWVNHSNPQTYTNLGQVLATYHLNTEAGQAYVQALQVAPQDLRARKYAAVALAQAGRIGEAREMMESVLADAPNDPEALSVMSLILANQGQMAAALADGRKAIALAPDQPLAYPPLFDMLRKLGSNTEAVAVAREGLRVNPFDLDLQYKLGMVLASEGDQTNALACFHQALAFKAQWPEVQQQVGLSLLALHQTAEALSELLQAVELKPEDAAMRYDLGQALEAEGRAADAEAAYRVALQLNPDWPPALNNLAWMLATNPDAQLRNGAEAVQLAAKACELTNRKTALYVGTLAAAYAETGRFAEAADTVSAAMEIARGAGEQNPVTADQKLLELYRSGRAWRGVP